MNDEQTKTTNNDSDDLSLCSMFHDFYNRRMLSVVILVWLWAIIFIGGAVYSGIQFFNTDRLRDQIMHAAIFICCFEGVVLIKIFAWQMIHRNAIKRHIKRLELRIAELDQTIKGK
jgi:Na+/melibiose symporter-like transporter